MSNHTDPVTTDLVSEPLDAEKARAKCVEAAEMIIDKHAPGGFYHWIDGDRLRVYRRDGAAFLTLKIEALQ